MAGTEGSQIQYHFTAEEWQDVCAMASFAFYKFPSSEKQTDMGIR